MTNHAPGSLGSHAAVPSAPAASESAADQAPRQDPAGGIRLSGRNRMCVRARALAGLVLTSGIVAALSTADTTSSMHHNFLG